MSRLILISGQPNSGKNFLAKELMRHFDSSPQTSQITGLTGRCYHYTRVQDYMTKQGQQFWNQIPCVSGGCSVETKALSEYAKLRGDVEEFTNKVQKLLADRLLIIVEAGEAAEMMLAIKTIGAKNVMLIEITKEGHSDREDSRQYPALPVMSALKDETPAYKFLVHKGDDELFVRQAIESVEAWIKTGSAYIDYEF